MKDYVAVVKRNGDNELQHFKYIKREKKNGKWVYYYDDSELKKYESGATEKHQIRKNNGTEIENHETTYKLAKDRNDPTKTVVKTRIGNTNSPGATTGVSTTKYLSVRDQKKAKVEKYIYDKALSTASREKRKKAINKGKQKLKSLFS